jgi:hypothetical protein
MAKILKCASNDDVITLEARDETDALTLKFESPSEFAFQLLDVTQPLLPFYVTCAAVSWVARLSFACSTSVSRLSLAPQPHSSHIV